MNSIQQQVKELQEANHQLLDTLATRDEELNLAKELLASLNRGVSGKDNIARASESAVLEGRYTTVSLCNICTC